MQPQQNDNSASRRHSEFDFRIKITPPQTRNGTSGRKCLYGISISAGGKSPNILRAGYEWAVANFDQCSILLGDSLYRITLQIQRGLNPEEAGRVAYQEGQLSLRAITSTFKPSPRVICCSEVIAMPGFSAALHSVLSYYLNNDSFRDSVRSDASAFVTRQARHNTLAIDSVSAMDLAVHYLHEEIAVYLILSEAGWQTDVYVGQELPTLRRIITGEVDGAPDALRQRVNISLRPRSTLKLDNL